MSKLRSYIVGLLIIIGFSTMLQAQKFQATLSALSLDFNRETKWNPFDSELEFPSAVGLTISFPTSQYLSFGANLKYGTVQKATDDLIRELNGEQLFSLSGASRLQKVNSRYVLNPFLQFAVGGQKISKEDGIKAIVNLGLGTDIRLYKNLNLNISTAFTREVSRNRYFIDYGLGLTWAIHDGSPQLDRIQDDYVEERNDFDGDGLADVDDDCPDLAGTVASGGCPDMDEDGVPDVRDLCPEEAGLVGNDGCPLYTGTDSSGVELKDALMTDSDGDGVVDAEDQCPNQYGNLQNLGCPDPDGDNDGVVDSEDLCPEIPGSIDNSGCPDDLDISSLLNTNPASTDPLVNKEVASDDSKPVSPSDLPSIEEDSDKLGDAPDLVQQENKSEGMEPLSKTNGVEDKMNESLSELNEENLKDQIGGVPPASSDIIDEDETNQVVDVKTEVQEEVIFNSDEIDEEERVEKEINTISEKETRKEKKLDTNRVIDLVKSETHDTIVSDGKVEDDQVVSSDEKEKSTAENKQVTTLEGVPFEDRDGDGIANHIDPCPDLFGTLTNKGCPDGNKNADIKRELSVNDGVSLDYLSEVRFEPGLASINRKYIPVMDDIAEYMLTNSELKLEILGHTDSQGSDKLNDVLSERRAKACYIYLRVKGVPFDRMTYTGLGERQPKVDNISSTKMGLNRRVVFRFKR